MATPGRNRKFRAITAALLIGAGCAFAGAADKADFIMVKPDDLKWGDVNSLPPGSVVVMPPKMHHYAWTTEPTVVQLNTVGPWDIVYLNPADDPRKKK